jgi:hypothetical protein
VAALAALAGLTLAGCGSGAPEPTAIDETSLHSSTPSASSTPTPTRTPTPTASATNPGKVVSRGPGPTGPEADAVRAFVTRYVEEINRAIETGDVSRVRPLYTSGCLDCVQLVSSIRSTYGGGGKFVGGLYTQNQVDVFGQSGPTYMVHVTSLATAWKQYDKSGTVVNQGPAERVTYSYGVRQLAGSWQLTAGGKSQ